MTAVSEGALRLLLQFVRTQEADDAYAFRFAPQDYILLTADGGSPTARFDWSPELLADLQALRQPGVDPALVQRVGEKLRRFVKDAGWLQHEAAIVQALAAGRAVVLTIRSSAAELYALPWELLSLQSGQRLGELSGLLLRFEWPESSTAPEPSLSEGGRILLAWSAAGGAVPAAAHVSAISRACEAGFHAFEPERDVLPHASLDRLVQRLAAAEASGQPIAVLHLLCHGSDAGATFGLVLDGAQAAAVVDAAQLRQQLAPFAKMVRLVVLSACNAGSAGTIGNHLGSIAQALHRVGFASVVASRFPLAAASSVALTETLYQGLLGGPQSLESAFVAARQRLLRQATSESATHRSLDWASLQLYARQADGEDSRPVIFRPFRGLLAFQPEHSRFYFGRDREIGELLAKQQALAAAGQPRFLVVAGASGSGKSSLVLAGLVPRLLAEEPALRWRRLRPGSDPEQALAQALAELPAGEGGPALLVVDQFEELFTHGGQAAVRTAFAERLWALAAAPQMRVVITLRVDFLGRCGELRLDRGGLTLEQVAYDEAHRLFVSQLGPQQVRASIVEPVRKVGLELEAGLADRMLAEVGLEPGTLPLLEDVLDVLWQRRRGRTLTQASYDEIGGVFGALQRRAEALIDKLSAAQLAMARRLLTSLVAVADSTAQDTRLRVPLAELVQSCAEGDTPRFEQLLAELVAARLLVQGGAGAEAAAQVELAHETLIRKWSRLRGWLDEDRGGLALHRRVKEATRQWEAHGRDEGLLFRGGLLAQAREWRKNWERRLADDERRFLDASEALRLRLEQDEAARREKERQRARQSRIAAVVLALLLLLAVGAGVRAYRESQQSRNGLMISVALALKDDPTSAALVLREAALRDSTLWRQWAIRMLDAGPARDAWPASAACEALLAVSPDGSQLVCGGTGGTVLVRSDGSGKPVNLGGSRSEIRAAVFSPDGLSVITGSKDGTIQRVPLDGSPALRLFPENHTSVGCLAVSTNGKRLFAAVSGDENLGLVGSSDGSPAQVVLRDHESSIDTAVFSSDGQKVAIAYGFPGLTARVYRSDGQGQPLVLSGHQAAVVAVAFDPAGSRLITGSADSSARVYKLDGSGGFVNVAGHTDEVVAVAFSPDGKQVATASRDETLRITGADDGLLRRVFVGQRNLATVAFAADGKSVLSASSDGAVRRWSFDPILASRLLSQNERVSCSALVFIADGKVLCGGSVQREVRLYDLDAGRSSERLAPPFGGTSQVTLSADGRYLAIATLDHNILVQQRGSAAPPIAIKGPQDIRQIVLSTDGRKVLVGTGEPVALLYDTAGGGAAQKLGGHEGEVTAVALRPDGNQAATGSRSGLVRLWRSNDATPPRVLSGHGGPITALAFSPDGSVLLSAAEDRTVRLWRLDGNHAPALLTARAGLVTVLAFSSDGRRIAIGSTDDRSGSPIAIDGRFSTVRVLDIDGGSEPLMLKGHSDDITAIAFSPSGERLVTSSVNEEVRGWLIGSPSLHEALWQATDACLPEARRRELLLESEAAARSGWERCQHEVQRRRGSVRKATEP